jgi:hypothetical protein
MSGRSPPLPRAPRPLATSLTATSLTGRDRLAIMSGFATLLSHFADTLADCDQIALRADRIAPYAGEREWVLALSARRSESSAPRCAGPSRRNG